MVLDPFARKMKLKKLGKCGFSQVHSDACQRANIAESIPCVNVGQNWVVVQFGIKLNHYPKLTIFDASSARKPSFEARKVDDSID
jgi:hypothetical protein